MAITLLIMMEAPDTLHLTDVHLGPTASPLVQDRAAQEGHVGEAGWMYEGRSGSVNGLETKPTGMIGARYATIGHTGRTSVPRTQD